MRIVPKVYRRKVPKGRHIITQGFIPVEAGCMYDNQVHHTCNILSFH